MPHYKTLDNQIYFLDHSEELADHEITYLPTGSVKITDEEADAIRTAQRIAAENSKTYAEKRASEYPSITEQFDLLYHGGLDAWKDAIKTIKDKYPKV